MKLTEYLHKDLSSPSFSDNVRKIARTENLEEDIKELVLAVNRLHTRLINLEEKHNGNN